MVKIVSDKFFECLKCGDCCRWEGFVWLLPEDITRLAEHFNISSDYFLKKFARNFQGNQVLQNKPGSMECIFLDSSNQCSVYSYRPQQCSEYPIEYDKRCPGFNVNKDSSMKSKFEKEINTVQDKTSSSDYLRAVSDGLYRSLMAAKSSLVAQEALESGFDSFLCDRQTMRVANLSDLFAFDRLDKKHLIHKSTKDLWSIDADSGGEVSITRLFDDSGEPIKG